jgi:mono/diheme cytochrome c family protein
LAPRPTGGESGGAGRALAAVLVGLAIGLSPSATTRAREGDAAVQAGATGAGLAAIGGCQGCHTSEGGAPFAGGRAFATPFGVIYSTNITPDKDHGIGGWTEGDFERAMTRGIGPRGERYYPVFPYPHFALASGGDIAAIYGYLQTIPPAAGQSPPNRLVPPFGLRSMLIGWQALYLRANAPDTEGLDAQARRGAELVAGLGHCGACHTPHNALGAEDAAHPLAGAMAEGWYAPPLQGDSDAPLPWTAEELETYLRTGLSDRHQAAAGPMGAVARELAQAPEQEVRDMAIYLSGLTRPAKRRGPVDEASAAAQAWPEGARIYAGACASCHEPGAGMSRSERPSLALGTPFDEDRPTDVIMILLKGLDPGPGKAGPFMPSFANSLTDMQLVQLTAYLRARFSREPAWPHLDGPVRAARKAAA